MRPRRRSDNVLAALGVFMATVLVAVLIPVGSSVLAQTTPTPYAGGTPSPTDQTGTAPSGGPTPAAGPSGSPVPGPSASASPGLALPPAGAASITDTEYLSVKIDADGNPDGAPLLKDWLRVRGPSGALIRVSDPAVLDGVKPLSGSPAPRQGRALDWEIKVPDDQFRDLYYEGKVAPAGDGLYATASGPKELPISVDVKYYTGAPGSETRVGSTEWSAQRGPAKLVFEVRNNTRQMQELTYNDVQTKKDVTAVAPVWTPYVVKIGPILFPDDQFDRLQTDGVATRVGNGTEVTWTLNLAPPDYPGTQTAIAQFLVATPKVPDIRIAAQPQYPPAQAEAVGSEGIQFEKGRRSFLFDVFDLLRSNLVALTGLFGLLDDAFSNLAIPLISPEKHNRERGTFDDPNQLWALWTLTKGIENLNRATDVLDYSLQLSRDAVKGEIGTMSQVRHLLGKSADPSNVSIAQANLLNTTLNTLLPCLTTLSCTPAQVEGALTNVAEAPNSIINQVLAGSIWSNIKDTEVLAGCGDCGTDPNPELPEAPLSVTPLSPTTGLLLSVIRLKMALLEQDLAAMQKENHRNQYATFSGVSNLPLSPRDWRKYTTITFPFGMEELADGLYQLKVKGVDLIQQALGNKDTPNSLIWAMHVLTDGQEGLSDAFHNLGSTWRYLADSLQNFGLFGVETAKNTLQLDINKIDLASAQRAAAAARVTSEATTFMGSPEGTKKLPVDTQFVLSFSTTGEREVVASALQTTAGKFATALAFGLLILVILGFARFRWYLL